MPAKKTVMVVIITAIVVLLVYPRLKALPGVNKLPTI